MELMQGFDSVVMESPDMFCKLEVPLDLKNQSLYSLTRRQSARKPNKIMHLIRPAITTKDLIQQKRNEPVLIDRTLKFSTTKAASGNRISSALGIRSSLDSAFTRTMQETQMYSSLISLRGS